MCIEQAGEYAQVVAMPPQRMDTPSTPELRLADFLAFLIRAGRLCVSPKHLIRWIWYVHDPDMAPVPRGHGSDRSNRSGARYVCQNAGRRCGGLSPA